MVKMIVPIFVLYIFCTEAFLLPKATGYEPFLNKIHADCGKTYGRIRKSFDISGKHLNESVEFGKNVIARMERLEKSINWANVKVQQGSPSKGLYRTNAPNELASKKGKDATIIAKATTYLTTHCYKHKLSAEECSKLFTELTVHSTPLHESCQSVKTTCSEEAIASPYRSVDGFCNHVYDGTKGASNTPYKRLLYPDYLDGIREMRRSVTKKPLPSARVVSMSVLNDTETENLHLTLSVSHWRDFLEHDLAQAAASLSVHTNEEIQCCSDDGSHLSPRYLHPFCAPINVPFTDDFYSNYDLNCMSYVRSLPALKSGCNFGPINQLNQVTHFLDGSQIYGSASNSNLRTRNGGQLQAFIVNNQEYPPIEKCSLSSDSNDRCFKSGDSRINEIPPVTALYTIWIREHNRVAKALSKLNPKWDDEKLYQEARRIVVAEMQHITYTEFLPAVLGKSFEEPIKYDETTDPSISNSFAHAALRSLYSLLDESFSLYTEDRIIKGVMNLEKVANKPGNILETGYMDDLLRGMTTQKSQEQDMHITPYLKNKYFTNGQYGYDIFALDIQRGRDHGLPSYTAFRKLCGLKEVNNFDELDHVMPHEALKSLKKLYASPKDIDLIVGGLLEKPHGESLLGPTFTCIFNDQMTRTVKGDRYFYTNKAQPKPFTDNQLKNIQQVTLARVLCDNTNIKFMQPNVFKTIDNIDNTLMNCNELSQMNLAAWKELIF